jgi:hypothetical protein
LFITLVKNRLRTAKGFLCHQTDYDVSLVYQISDKRPLTGCGTFKDYLIVVGERFTDLRIRTFREPGFFKVQPKSSSGQARLQRETSSVREGNPSGKLNGQPESTALNSVAGRCGVATSGF